MLANIQEFNKAKDFLICVDSDGCAMDTMDIKHEECFGPKAVEVWGLEDIKDRFMKVWLDLNLYTRTRGINRFKGLVAAFDQLKEEGYDVPDLSSVKKWVETTNELSAPSLAREIEKTNDEQLKNTLEWSNRVNDAIKQLPESKPFPKAKEGLAAAHEVADVAIVSSANSSAVEEEWTEHGLAEYVSIMCGQEAGTKAYCIGALKEKGYDSKHVLMIGDAPGDLKAAQENGVFYYPILVGKEEESWNRLIDEALGKFLDGTFAGEYQEKLIEEFYSILK